MIDKGAYSGILSSKAQKEIAFSWEWYEDRQYGLGDRFVQEIIANIQTIEQYPERQATKYKNV
jgi:hypothetical protein